MTYDIHSAILLVCADEDTSLEILDQLDAEGLRVVGPAPTAGLALMLTAQTPTRSAILVGETTGRRTAEELAAELTSLWGVECFIIPNEAKETADGFPVGPAADIRRLLSWAGRPRRLN